MTGPEERKAGAGTPGYDDEPGTRERAAVPSRADREARIRTRAYRLWEESGRPDGQAEEHWHRAAQDLDREDAEIRRAGAAEEKPGVKPRERS